MFGIFSRPQIRRVVCLLLALLAVSSFADLLRTGQDDVLINHSIVSILLWWACYQLLDRACRCMNRRLLAISLCVGLSCSLMMVLGANVMQYETANLTALRTWRSVFCAWPLFGAACALLIDRLPAMKNWPCAWLEKTLARMKDRTFFLVCWGLVFLSWLPGLLASYPGVYAYDCAYQLRDYLNGTVTTHHPIIHTAWLAACVVELGGLLGSYEAGMCVYSLAQMLLFSAAFASILSFLRRMGTSAVMQLICLILFMVLPTNAIFSFSGTKDVAFAAMMIWLLIPMLEAAREPEKLKDKRFWQKTLAAAFGMMIFRNQGVYVFALAMLVGLACMAKQRRRVLALLAAGLVLFGLYQGPVTTLSGVKRATGVQEMLSVPAMQLSRVRKYYEAELSPEDKAAIEAYIPDWKNYSSISCAIADPVKNTFNNDLFHENPLAFAKLWLRMGISQPAAYVDAFLRLTAGFWYPDMPYRDWPAYQPYFQYEYHQPETTPQLEQKTPAALAWLHDLYLDLSLNNTDQKIPVLSLLTSSSLAAWILLLFIAWAVYKRKWRMLWPATLLFGLWLTLLLGPVVLMRYALPLIMAEPLLIGVMRTQSAGQE